MVKLTIDEINWLKDNYPSLNYCILDSSIRGVFPFCLKYRKTVIQDSFKIFIDLQNSERNTYPKVYSDDPKFRRLRILAKLPREDVHINKDGALCLGLPEKFLKHHPNGLTIWSLVNNLNSFFYWIAYYYRYQEAPWKSEPHGYAGRIIYRLQNMTN